MASGDSSLYWEMSGFEGYNASCLIVCLRGQGSTCGRLAYQPLTSSVSADLTDVLERFKKTAMFDCFKTKVLSIRFLYKLGKASCCELISFSLSRLGEAYFLQLCCLKFYSTQTKWHQSYPSHHALFLHEKQTIGNMQYALSQPSTKVLEE